VKRNTDKESKDEIDEEIGIDFNLAKNLLESFKSQGKIISIPHPHLSFVQELGARKLPGSFHSSQKPSSPDPRWSLEIDFKSQAGMAGPGGNLLGLMGMQLPRDEDSESAAAQHI
jgi:hypothetical protein